MTRIAIVAGEVSGDIIASGLIRAIKKRIPDAEFFGIAGPLMKEQGCREIYPMEKLAVMGFSEVLGKLREILGIRKAFFASLKQDPPDVFIGVDAPDFNLKLETWLHQQGIKTVHYVSPSVWAWRKYRIKRIKKSVDLMLTLFPFETRFYQEHAVPVEFVGHPLADTIPLDVDIIQTRNQLRLEQNKKYVALLPGSRMSEVTRLAEIFIGAAKQCHETYPDLEFIVPFVNDKTKNHFDQVRRDLAPELSMRYFDGQSREVMAASDIVVLASGTATLEATLLKKPMVVAYKVSAISYRIYRTLVNLKYVSLPNLLGGEELVPELLQNDATVENISREILAWLDDDRRYQTIQATFERIHRQLRQDASESAAESVIKLIG